MTGAGTKWTNSGGLTVGQSGNGTLDIKEGGLVSVGGTLTIGNSSDFINMATGGMLAIFGDADDSLTQFLALISGTDAALRYLDDSLTNWEPITSAIFGVDYTLKYLTSGDLAGYTLLTVGEASLPDLAGDFDSNSVVDGADFLAWQRNPGIGSLADWKANFGANLSSTIVSVPEPTGLSFLCVCIASFVTHSSRSSSHPTKRHELFT